MMDIELRKIAEAEEAQTCEIKEALEKQCAKLEEMQSHIIELQSIHSRQQGFIGGMVFVIGGVGAIATFIANKYF